MEIILLQKVANLGQIGDRVKVKSGYARNFLVPTGRATMATPANIAKFEAQRAPARSQGPRGACGGAGARREVRELQARAQGQGRHRRQAVRLHRHGGHRRGRRAGGTPDRTQRSAHAHRTDPHHRRAPGAAAPAHRRRCDLDGHRSSPKSSGRQSRARRLHVAAARVGNRLGSSAGADDGLRLPPHSIEAEQSVLGGLMLDSAAWDQVADRVRAEDFYRNDHRLIFGAVAGLIERNQPCDAVTLSGHLDAPGPARSSGRPRVSRLARPRHADRRQHPRLCGHRARALGAAPAHHRGQFDRQQRARARRARGARNRRRRGARGVRDRRARRARAGSAFAPSRASCRTSSTGSTSCTTPTAR